MMNMEISHLGSISPHVGVLLITAGLVYGLFGWRLVRYLAVADAIGVACFLGMVLNELNTRGTLAVPSWPLTILLIVGLPWIAWRCGRWSVIAMGGLIGFVAVQLIIGAWDLPLLVRVLLGGLGGGFVMATHFTLYRHAAIVVTSLHGGWMLLAGLTGFLGGTGTMGFNFALALRTYDLLTPAMVLIFTWTMMQVQWADLDRSADPF